MASMDWRVYFEQVVNLDSCWVQLVPRYITAPFEPCVLRHVVRALVCLKSLTVMWPVVVYMLLEITAFIKSDPSVFSFFIPRSAFPCFLCLLLFKHLPSLVQHLHRFHHCSIIVCSCSVRAHVAQKFAFPFSTLYAKTVSSSVRSLVAQKLLSSFMHARLTRKLVPSS